MNKILQLLQQEFHFSTYNPIVGWVEASRWNGTQFLHGILTSFTETGDEKPYTVETPTHNGGIIVFSTDVNAKIEKLYPDASFLKKKVLGVWESITNRINRDKKLNRILAKHEEAFGFSVGNFFKGKYKSDSGEFFDETSTSIEIIGIPFELVCTIAAEIARSFKQESILVKDNSSFAILFVYPKEL